MISRWLPCLMFGLMAIGCNAPTLAVRDQEPATPRVGLSPFTEPRVATVQAKIDVAAAPPETAIRVELVGRKLISENSQLGRPNLNALGSPDPEIFHVGQGNLYITDGLVKQCATDGQLAAVLANEMGRMISEREASVSDDIRRPEPFRPIEVPIGANGNNKQLINEIPAPLFIFRLPAPGSANSRDADAKVVEVADWKKMYGKSTQKLTAPNPQFVARDLLEHAGYLRTELDGAQAILDNAARFSTLQSQFNGSVKQADWKQP